jgi:hypothetical protein
MAGIASLFGGNSAKADRNAQLTDRGALTNLYDYALPVSQRLQTTGGGLQGEAGNYFSNLLRAGRSDTALSAAPAINANLSAEDAKRRREALTGTGRTGGTAELNREAGVTTDQANADIVNKTLQSNRATGAAGAEQVGSDQAHQALQALGLSDQMIQSLLSNATESRKTSQDLHDQAFAGAGSDIGNAIAGGSKIASILMGLG